jgi:hypothetical protein
LETFFRESFQTFKELETKGLGNKPFSFARLHSFIYSKEKIRRTA